MKNGTALSVVVGAGVALGCAATDVAAQERRADECGAESASGIAGTVSDAATGVPLPGVAVIARWSIEGASETAEATTGAGGEFLLCDVPAALQVMVTASFGGRSARVSVRSGAEEASGLTLEIPLAASGKGRVVGRVLAREGRTPLSAATVRLLSEWEGEDAVPIAGDVTSANGAFTLEDVSPGEYGLEITHIGYATARERVPVLEGRTTDVSVELTVDPVELEPLVVTTVRSRRLETVGFYERMSWGERTGLGSYIMREDIERRRPLRVSHLLGDVPGVRLHCSGASCTVRMVRGVNCDAPNLYVDNVLINRRGGRASPDGVVNPDDVAGIEVYRGPSELPAEYAGADARCGAIVIWTRSAP